MGPVRLGCSSSSRASTSPRKNEAPLALASSRTVDRERLQEMMFLPASKMDPAALSCERSCVACARLRLRRAPGRA
eukprot:2154603-Alexandrium_andersonii.AAC.1